MHIDSRNSDSIHVGQRVRARRMQLQLRIKDLAERSGLSCPFLSQLEHGHTQASVESLIRISKALEVSLSYLVDSFTPGSMFSILAPKQFHYFSLLGSAASFARIGIGDNQRQLEPLLIALPPYTHIEKLDHVGEAFLFVLQGGLEVCISDQTYRLEAGHAAHLLPGIRYSYTNPNTVESRLVWVGTPRLF